MHFAPLLVTSLFAGNALAHPGHDVQAEIAERAAFMQTSKRDLSHCAAKMKARGIEKRSISRRAASAEMLRMKRNIASNAPYYKARDVGTVLSTSHLSSEAYSITTDEAILFAGNNSCVLSPEVTQGPYYVSGEYVRENVVEEQKGVELVLDTQVIDMATCDPVPDAMIEIWHCNSTGVYSGIVAQGNGVGTSDPSNLNNTFLRGLQPTDAEGVAQFTTLFPGHYTGRAAHIHILAHFNGTIFPNGTYGGGYVSHVGQVFFDQDLITQVEAVSPYSTNTQPLTLNSEDNIFSSEAASSDPVIEYSLVGDDVSSGIFGWIAFGIDLTNEFSVSAAASLYAEGGVENPSSGGPGGPGMGGPPNGTAPPNGTGPV
ncbi:uncharacterized protein BP5553_04026 [Venustampulla echinocandica]|uniref:Intradiol ring-cleavage dioxygenases domain-containing protein n=1 Tax=Venustampulla echinocandica TaxID=2656787 RepID=A0A370TVX7_9HELO|nr:uncharacterized protein BP5553_04026 [Venustampulla echinocandica]RDL39686.1 hypothetical protein BP5553_04026 [Venustampulla echinocandica]